MTDLLPKFISTKTGRPFSAYLAVDDAGKITFEFPERGAAVAQSSESS
jgi:DNA topoisomerase-3